LSRENDLRFSGEIQKTNERKNVPTLARKYLRGVIDLFCFVRRLLGRRFLFERAEDVCLRADYCSFDHKIEGVCELHKYISFVYGIY
jgi:hypothetical protein